MHEVDRRRAANQPTVPSTLAEELSTNPFLRPDSVEIQTNLGMVGAPLAEVFGATRLRKDGFRG
jgi:hydroxyacylglutathione hydrolase